MSSVNFLEKLLDGVEVEWKALGEVCRFINGRAYKQPELLSQGKYPVLRVDNFFTNDNWYYSSLELDEDKYCDKGDLLYAWSASFGPRIWGGDKVIYHYHIWKVVPNADLIHKKFLYYLLEWDTKALKEEHGTGSTMMHVGKGSIEKRLIPIPCPDNPKKSLAIQAEIVRILDTFTELTAELTARKKQYNYYRDQLLSFDDGEVEWKALGEVGEFIRGKRFTKADYVEDGISVIHYGEIYTRYGISTSHALSQVRSEMATSLRYAEPGDVVITDVGETVEDVGKAVAWIGNEKVAIHDHCYAFRHSMNPKFVSYCMQTASFIDEKAKYVARTKVNTLLIKGFSKIRVPIPPLPEQERIVAILDKFDALTHSITEGLPREIELRQRQYAYYRDLLLSFPKPEEMAA
ncbi:restriction endonuclease subunit S [Acidithiobacillus sp. IBUN Pt1247-S3]|uniref:restriction endonuclease subunit S n=1 Tax=Acidithiobacillus sp. IBUN Pt1247-S3 TaxID=3166642 RepID=UPI0034E5119A